MRKLIIILAFFLGANSLYAQNFEDFTHEKMILIKEIMIASKVDQILDRYITSLPHNTTEQKMTIGFMEQEKDSMLIMVAKAYVEAFSYDELRQLHDRIEHPEKEVSDALKQKFVVFLSDFSQYFEKYMERVKGRVYDMYSTEATRILELEDPEAAHKKLDSLLLIDPNNIDALEAKGVLHSEAGKMKYAIVYLEKAIGLDTNRIRSKMLLAEAYYTLKELDQAKKYLNMCLALDTFSSELKMLQGRIACAEYRFDEAVNIYTQLLSKATDDRHELYFNRAYNYKLMGDTVSAKKDFYDVLYLLNQLEKVDPANTTTMDYQVRTYYELHRYAEILPIAHKLVELEPENHNHRYRLALAYDDLGRHEESIRHFDTFIMANPLEINALNTRAYVALKIGKYEMAKQDLRLALSIAPNGPFLHSNLGRAYTLNKEFKEAEKSLKRSIELDPHNSYALKYYGQLELARNNKDKACYYFQEALRKGFTVRYGGEVQKLMDEHCN